jgi:hypothetical protein
MAFKILNENGLAMDAHFHVEEADIIFHSRGGSKAQKTAINTDYSRALRLLFDQIFRSSLQIEGVWVDSRSTRRLSLEERAILTHADMSNASGRVLKLMLSRMRKVGRPAKAKGGGNCSKRIRIKLSGSRHDREALFASIGRRNALKARRGPPPTSRTSTVTWNAVGFGTTYLLRFGSSDSWKIGWTNNLDRRLRVVNKHIPYEHVGELWNVYMTVRWPNWRRAYRAEQAFLDQIEHRTGGSEHFQRNEDEVRATWISAVTQGRPI